MRLRKNKIRRRQPDEKKKGAFFASQSAEEKSPFFSGNEKVQRKLSVGKSDDPAEKEAESAAKKVVNQPLMKAEKKEEEPVKKAEKKEEEPVKKAEKKEEEPVKKAEKEEEPVKKAEKKEEEPVKKAEKEEEPVKKAEKKEEEPVKKAEKEEESIKKAEKKEEEKPVQAKADPSVQASVEKEKKEQGDGSSHTTLENMLVKQKGRGFVLPDDLRMEMEKKFHANFKEVRVHTDKEAEEMCEHLHALAFTHGHDIYFNAGKYNPNAASGKELLAHELAHVVQNG